MRIYTPNKAYRLSRGPYITNVYKTGTLLDDSSLEFLFLVSGCKRLNEERKKFQTTVF